MSEKNPSNERIRRSPDGSYHWSCRIDRDFHRRSAVQGVWACVFIAAFILVICAFMPSRPGETSVFRTALIPVGVVLGIALPLLFLQYHAPNPREQYVLEESHVRSGYGKGSIYTEFRRVRTLIIAPDYMELTDDRRSNRIYVPAEDMAFVREFIMARLPDGINIKHI